MVDKDTAINKIAANISIDLKITALFFIFTPFPVSGSTSAGVFRTFYYIIYDLQCQYFEKLGRIIKYFRVSEEGFSYSPTD